MKNYTIFEVHWKTWLLEQSHKKPLQRGGYLNKGTGQFQDLKGFCKKEGVMFLRRVDTPIHTVEIELILEEI